MEALQQICDYLGAFSEMFGFHVSLKSLKSFLISLRDQPKHWSSSKCFGNLLNRSAKGAATFYNTTLCKLRQYLDICRHASLTSLLLFCISVVLIGSTIIRWVHPSGRNWEVIYSHFIPYLRQCFTCLSKIGFLFVKVNCYANAISRFDPIGVMWEKIQQWLKVGTP